jgi:hypothetical protein
MSQAILIAYCGPAASISRPFGSARRNRRALYSQAIVLLPSTTPLE